MNTHNFENDLQKINQINSNPYFIKLNNNTTTIPEFLKSQIDFIYCVNHWTRILASSLLHTKIFNHPQSRMIIVKNLYDEQGANDSSNSHFNTFKKMLEQINQYIEDKGLKEETDTKTLNKLTLLNKIARQLPLNNHCFQFIQKIMKIIQNPLSTRSRITGVLGMIEYVYVSVSSNIYNYLKKNQIEVDHYNLHSTLDIEHSKELFSLIDNYQDGLDGIKLGYQFMNELYTQMNS